SATQHSYLFERIHDKIVRFIGRQYSCVRIFHTFDPRSVKFEANLAQQGNQYHKGKQSESGEEQIYPNEKQSIFGWA
ncbi:MAG: hypothetical protein AB7S88_03620, partial [Candidatus Izemoplasmatales bacterium]